MGGIVQACIFDLDGVLTDTAHLHFISWRRLGRELGYELSEDKNRELKGVSRSGSLDLILKWAGKSASDSEKLEMMELKNNWYLEEIKQISIADQLPGASEFLDQLDRARIPYSLGSGSKNAKIILGKIGLAHRFNWVVDGNDVSRGKPDPELFIKAADLMNSKRSSTVVFEDSSAGISAALRGGFLAVGFGTDEKLKEIAHLTIESWDNIDLEFLESGLSTY